ncbi:MAG: hypothetical protein RLZZ490_2622 [Cyanobacteriota bacterium]|jgi:uncharacterized protein (DUF427 family)
MAYPEPIPPQPGQESVWDYPRPPRLEPSNKQVKIIVSGITLAESQQSQRLLETSHPPVYYLPLGDIQTQYLIPSTRHSYCEWKGEASYYHLKIGDRQIENAGWYYPSPTATFADIQNHVAFYPSKMDACYLDGELVTAQPGDFYGGWITPDIVGPFKGGMGTWGW